MTAHRVVLHDDPDGITIACLDCDLNERGYGDTEQARPVARLHEAEARIDRFDVLVRCRAGQAAEVAVGFPPSGYSAGYAAAMRKTLADWTGGDTERGTA